MDAFSGNVDRMMTNEELTQAIRLDIVGELEAINQYQSHILATNNQLAKNVLTGIRNEEMVHVGELMGLLMSLSPAQKEGFERGLQEFESIKSENTTSKY